MLYELCCTKILIIVSLSSDFLSPKEVSQRGQVHATFFLVWRDGEAAAGGGPERKIDDGPSGRGREF